MNIFPEAYATKTLLIVLGILLVLLNLPLIISMLSIVMLFLSHMLWNIIVVSLGIMVLYMVYKSIKGS